MKHRNWTFTTRIILLAFLAVVASPPYVAGARAPVEGTDHGPSPDVVIGDGTWRGLGPAPRCWGPTGVFDPVRNRMIVFGGIYAAGNGNPDAPRYFNTVRALSLAGSPSWSVLTTPAGDPTGRWSHAAIYDPVRDRMIVFGGAASGSYRNDVWSLSLSGTPTWTELFPSGVAPAARAGHTAIYDPVRDCMLVFGGNDMAGVDHNDVWELSLGASPAWTLITPAGTPPPARAWHSAIYDPVRDRMVIFGGSIWSPGGSLGDAWSLDLSGIPTWSPLAASGTVGARDSHSAVYDPVGDRMVMYGGYADPGNPAVLTVLSFSGSPAWSQIIPTGTPPSVRDGQAAIYDAPNHRMVVYAGIDAEFSHVWAATLGGGPAWSTLAPVGVPLARRSQSVYDAGGDRLLVLSEGNTGGPDSLRVWAQTMSGEPAWSRILPSGSPPSPRGGFSAMYDPVRHRVIVFGGNTPSPVNDVWALNLSAPAWIPLAPLGTPPSGRGNHTAVYDPIQDRMLVFGGTDGGSYNQVWSLSLSEPTAWSDLAPGVITAPAGRYGHTAIYDADRHHMVIFGGTEGWGVHHRDVWAFDLTSLQWSEITPAPALPSDRIWTSAIYDAPRERMLVFGGNNGAAFTNQLWSLSLAGTPTWTLLAPEGLVPDPRQEHEAIHDPVRDRMLVYGGWFGGGLEFSNEVWEYTPEPTVSVGETPDAGPVGLVFASPRPNPSREGTTFEFELPRTGRVTIEVFDVSGRRVRRILDARLPAGVHTAAWDGENDLGSVEGSGFYFARLRFGDSWLVRRIVRTR